MRFIPDEDDSDIQKLNFLKAKLVQLYDRVDEYVRIDEDGNQLLIELTEQRIERITGLLMHYMYN